jgi:hypothetical protein
MNYKEIKTNPEMNEKIVSLLVMASINYTLYAAKRIEELEAENEDLKIKLSNSCNPF